MKTLSWRNRDEGGDEQYGMRGHISRQTNLFVKINLEELVPAGHPPRTIKRMADVRVLPRYAVAEDMGRKAAEYHAGA